MERVKDPADPRRCKGAQPDGRCQSDYYPACGGKSTEQAEAERLAEFIAAECVCLPGLSVLFRDFASRFYAWLPAVERPAWTRSAIAAELDRLGVQRGLGTNNRQTIGNVDLRDTRPQLVRVGTKLVRLI